MIYLVSETSQWCPNTELSNFTPDTDVLALSIKKLCKSLWYQVS